MGKSGVAYCDYSLNYYTWDCTKTSPGCKHCYALAWAERLGRPVQGRPQWREKAVEELRRIPPGSVVFLNDMSDTFHETAPQAWIHRIHNLARSRPDLLFLELTKRAERMAGLAPFLDWPPNLWAGVSVENRDYLWRLDYLRCVPAAERWVSFGPLLGWVGEANLIGVAWAISEGESGPDGVRRYFDKDWARSVRDACRKYQTAFFHKQGSARLPGNDRLLDGRLWEEYPAGVLEHRVRWGKGSMPEAVAEPVRPAMPEPQQMSLF